VTLPCRPSELFTRPERSTTSCTASSRPSPAPCARCGSTGFNGIAHHVAQNVDLAIVAAADLPALRAHGRNRQWTNLRLLSAGASTFKYDLGSEDAEGNQDSTVSVFTRDSNGSVRHFYSMHPRMSDDIDQRGIDLLSPVWHILDLTRHGRDNWFAALSY
jgi:predicted dithiol-disulfide oxidoreductase (DUF899 family)